MSSEADWDELLKSHPVLSFPKGISGPSGKGEAALHLSLSSLPEFVDLDPVDDKPTPSGRRQAIAIKDADLIVAVGTEIRITSLGDSKGTRSTSQKAYKILHTPNVQFDIHQVCLNPNGKLLAVAGAFQVAVVVLPRTGFNKLVTATVDCKSFQVGQYHHAAESSAPIAKIDWHPWGQGGSTLLVMTTDGKLREYDISVDAEEPQQTISFVPSRRRSNSFLAEDAAEREVASFAFGKGRADWGPLTVYAVMRSGDVYAISPYMPKNASVPSSYVHALECYVSAKQEFVSKSTHGEHDGLATLYDYQHKYVSALLKQLPPGTAWPATTRLVPMHPPTVIRNSQARQGPFLLQPAPRTLEGSEGGDATDIVYMSFGEDAAEESDGETEKLGLVLVAFQDGKVDVYLDVEKVEARWELKQHSANELPMLAVYETIDLGVISALNKASKPTHGESLLDLVQGNHPVFQIDPIYDDTIYVSHAFGVHALQLRSLLKSLASILRNDSDAGSNSGFEASLESVKSTEVQPVLLTFSVEQQCSTPVIGVAIPNDVYLTYSMFILTSSMRMSVFPLTLRSDDSLTAETPQSSPEKAPLAIAPSPASGSITKSPAKATPTLALKALPPVDGGPPAYVSLLSAEPWTIPQAIARPTGLPSNARLSLPGSAAAGKEMTLTPETLRYLGTTVEKLSAQIHDAQLAHSATEARTALQEQEFRRQRETCASMLETVRALSGEREAAARARLAKVQEQQSALIARLERVLHAQMTKASPALSESEAKWFEELRRMKGEVVGAGKYDDRSLSAKAKLMRCEVDRLVPHLKEMKEKETARRKSLAENRESLGLSQAFELGKRSTEERSRISHMETEILRLAHVLDVSIGRPPSQRQQQNGNEEASEH